MLKKLGRLREKLVKWGKEHKILHSLYLFVLVLLGFLQGIISLIVLILPPDRPLGSR